MARHGRAVRGARHQPRCGRLPGRSSADRRAHRGRELRTEAWTQGHTRGLTEGRQAGKEDRSRNTWDLEGQRELETADSGYEPRFGVKTDYQAGYREGFRLGYGEGYGRR